MNTERSCTMKGFKFGYFVLCSSVRWQGVLCVGVLCVFFLTSTNANDLLDQLQQMNTV